ncbi:MAG: D-alanyl-D-alanine carboxypeptidase/D-alanyl-D-alanine-endopeptidase [Bacteroidales bacterium]|nr:D-alanyl-D-alanine carboxypeptidase/D-alanyl-D-alanine-endopeptidase [Bacteroidales bacterium]
MFRRFVLLIATVSLILTNYSCHEADSQRVAVNWWDSLQKVEADSLALAPLVRELQYLLSKNSIDPTTTSYLIIDDTEDNPVVLAEYRSNQLLIPASVQKILVTAAALEILGDKAKKDVYRCNLQSHNGLANKLLKDIGKKVYGSRTYSNGIRAVLNFWEKKGVDMTGVQMADGSGRRYDNFLTARQLVDILSYQTTAPTFGTFYSSLPLAGISGTLRNTLKGTIAEGKIRAKTGTLAAVKTLTGYASTVSGRKLIFAIIVNNYTCRNSTLKKYMDRVLVEMIKL